LKQLLFAQFLHSLPGSRSWAIFSYYQR
jgi:hypothetical protein